MTPEQAQALRAPFPPSAIGKLPKGGTTLDYVGHAAVTDRLLAVDPEWTWKPVAWAADGGPLVRTAGKDAELWISLTVAGVTRIGVGTVPAGSFDLAKQLLSDALRNAAMRFGVALDLWSKEDLTGVEPEPAPAAVQVNPLADRLAACKTVADTLTGVHADAWAEWKGEHPGWHRDAARLDDAHGELLELAGLMSAVLPADDREALSGHADPPAPPRAGRRPSTKETL